MELPSRLAIFIFALVVAACAYVHNQTLRWRGLTKDQAQWATATTVALFGIIYIALVVVGIA